MRKNDSMVSLNPEYGIEVTTLSSLAERVKDSNPELFSILTITVASILANDEKNMSKHCNEYLAGVVSENNLKDAIKEMLENPKDGDDNHKNPWNF